MQTLTKPSPGGVRLRTRGSFDRRVATRAAEGVHDGAEALVRAMRADLGAIPLCITAYLNDQRDVHFSASIMEHLTDNDTLWLIPSHPHVTLPELRGDSAFVLDLRNPVHRETAQHIVADALLLPPGSGLTEEFADHWHDCTALAVVDGAAEDGQGALLKRFKAVSVRLGNGLYACEDLDRPLRSAVAGLTSFIEKLKDDPRRRALIAASLQPLRDDSEMLVRLVRNLDGQDWPLWAVESLPSSYLLMSDQPERAYVWAYLQDCFDPESMRIVDHHAGGAILETVMRGSAPKLGIELGRFVQAVLEKAILKYPSDNAFYGVLNQVLLDFSLQSGIERIDRVRQSPLSKQAA